MRLSSRLVTNALTTYLRMGTTFVIGIFLTWYMIDQVGLVGLGMVSLAMGTLGMSALDNAIRQSIVRELAAAIASGERGRVERVLASALAFCACLALAMTGFFMALAAAAWLGVFRTPEGEAGLRGALGWLFVAEGVILALGTLMAPYTQALYASQRVGLDNVLLVVQRVTAALAAVVALGLVWPEGPLAERIVGYGIVRVVFAAGQIVLEVVAARLLVPALRLRRGAFSREEFRLVGGTAWHTGQVSLGAAVSLSGIAVLVNLFFGLTFNGIWQIVGQVGGHVRMIGLGLMRGIDPLSTHLEAAGRRRAIVDLMGRGIRYQLLAMLPVAALYALFMVPILDLWIGGRLAADEHLAAAGVPVDAALRLTAVMASINLAAEVTRMSTRPVERMLFGIGEVRSYAWFAKWAVALTLAGAAAVMAVSPTPVLAPLPMVAVNFIAYVVIVLAAASRRAGLPVAATLRRSLPRPLIVTLALVAPFAILRLRWSEISLAQLMALVAAIAVLAVPLAYFVGFERDERDRLREIVSRRPGFRGRDATPPSA